MITESILLLWGLNGMNCTEVLIMSGMLMYYLMKRCPFHWQSCACHIWIIGWTIGIGALATLTLITFLCFSSIIPF